MLKQINKQKQCNLLLEQTQRSAGIILTLHSGLKEDKCHGPLIMKFKEAAASLLLASTSKIHKKMAGGFPLPSYTKTRSVFSSLWDLVPRSRPSWSFGTDNEARLLIHLSYVYTSQMPVAENLGRYWNSAVSFYEQTSPQYWCLCPLTALTRVLPAFSKASNHSTSSPPPYSGHTGIHLA